MKNYKLTPNLGFLFVIVVVIPAIALSIIAIRSIGHEEAYIEKNMENTLLTEVIYVTSLVDIELGNIQEELEKSFHLFQSQGVEESLKRWENTSSLVDLPFLVSQSGEIIWPSYSDTLSNDAKSFLDWNKEFFANELRIPVYENIAVAYQDDILEDSDAESFDVAADVAPEPYIEEEGYQPSKVSSSGNFFTRARSSAKSNQYSSQQAMSQFEQYEPVREKVYEKAEKGGKQIALRKVQLGREKAKRENVVEEKSIFISEPQSFSEIISKNSSGIIPRFIEGKLELLFWRKLGDGRLVGCVIDQASFKDRILGVLPALYSSARILTVLDENGSPLIKPQEKASRDWSKPFVAREISEMIPHWEVAAYLTDPNIISSRVQVTALSMGMLILILFVSVILGGTLLLRSIHSEIALAQKKTTFVANVSHELKTPLTSIRMFSEMLRDKIQPDEAKKKKYLSIMASETERLTRLINNVLDFSRRDQGKKLYTIREFDIVALCEDVIESQRVRLENEGFEVNFAADSKQVIVRADEESMRQVMLNLLSNAEKYSDKVKKIDVRLKRKDGVALIAVKDRGIGIAPKEVKNIFKEFYRVDDTLTSKARGAGLGLAIAQRIMRDHRGDIKYFVRQGSGSIFEILIPITGA